MPSLKESIAKDVKDIKNTQKKQFGTKLPSNANKEQEQTEQQLAYEQMIMGSLASLIWGVKGKDKPTDIKSLLGRGNTIYDLVDSIKDKIDYSEVTTKKYWSTLHTDLNVIKKSLTKLDNLDLIYGLIESFSKQNTSQQIININESKVNLNSDYLSKIDDIITSIDAIQLSMPELPKWFVSDNIKDYISNLEHLKKLDTFENFINSFDSILKEGNNIDKNLELVHKDINQIIEAINNNSSSVSLDPSTFSLDNVTKAIIDGTDLLWDALVDIHKAVSLGKGVTNTQTIEINFNGSKGLEALNKLIEELSKDDSKGIETLASFKALNGLGNLLNVIASKDFNEKISNSNTAISKLSKTIKSNMGTLLDNIAEAFNTSKTITKDAGKFESAMDAVIKAISIDKRTVENSGINELLTLTETDGVIHNILKNLNVITNEVKIQYKNINSLGDFFESLVKVGDIGLIKRMKIRSNLSYFKRYLIESLPEVMQALAEASKEATDRNKIMALSEIGNFFNSLVKISEIDKEQRRKIKRNLKYIRNNFIDLLFDKEMGIVTNIINSIKEGTKDSAESLNALNSFFDKLYSTADFSFIDLLKLELKLEYFSHSIIRDLIIGDDKKKDAILQQIKNINTQDVRRGVEELGTVLDIINSINDKIPGLVPMLSATIRLNILTEAIIPAFKKTIEYLDNVPNMKISIKDSIDSIIDNMNELNRIPVIDSKTFIHLMTTSLILDFLARKINKWSFKDVEASSFFINLGNSIDSIKETIVALNSISSLDENILQMVSDFSWIVKYIVHETDTWSSLNIDKEHASTLIESIGSLLTENIDAFIDNVNKSNVIDKDKVAALALSYNAIESVIKIHNKVRDAEVLSYIVNDVITLNEIVSNVSTLVDTTKDIDIDKDIITKAKLTYKLLKQISKFRKLSLTMPGLNIALKSFEGSAKAIDKIVGIISNIDENDVKKSVKTMNAFIGIVATGAAILIAGGLAMSSIDVVSLGLFTICLSGFLFALAGSFRILNDSLKDSLNGAKEAITLVAAAGAILLLGASIIQYINVEGLTLFVVSLSGFLLGISVALGIFNKLSGNSLQYAKEAVMLVSAAATILIVGSLIMKAIDTNNLFLFTGVLSGFILALGATFWGFTKMFNGALESTKDVIILTTAAASVLLLGSKIIEYIDLVNLFKFTATLGAFLLALGAIFKFFNEGFKDTMKGVKDAIVLVGASALILFTGAAILMNYPDLYLHVLGFGVLLGAFVFGITTIFKHNMKDIGVSTTAALGLGALVAISSIVLLGAAAILKKHDDLYVHIVLFGAMLYGFVWIMTKALTQLSKNILKIAGGIIALAALGVAIYGLTYVFGQINELGKSIEWGSFIGTLLTMVITTGILLGICRIIGEPEVLVYVALGELALAGIAGLIWLFGKAMSSVAQSMKDIASVSNIKINFTNLFVSIGKMIALSAELTPIAAMTPIVSAAAISMKAMKMFLGDMGSMLKDWSSLTIPVYDENGKYIGKKALSKEDITNATKHIGATINTLFGTVRDIYDKNSDMFDYSISSIFSGGSKFSRVARSGKALGQMLSYLSEGMKDWADFRIPIYQGTKVVGYHTIVDDDITNAAKNVATVITTLGLSIVDVYNGKVNGKDRPEVRAMFQSEDHWYGKGDTPFAKVVRSISPMGNMLVNLAKGIQSWGNLKIPIYKPGTTEISGYIDLNKKETFKNLGDNIALVVTALGKAIVEVYDKAEDKSMFDAASWTGFGESKLAKLVNSIKPMGDMLVNLAKGIQSFAELKIPVYAKNSKGELVVSDYITIKDDDFSKVGINIEKVLTAIGSAITTTFKGNERLFVMNGGPIKTITESINKTADTVKNISSVIANYASGRFPITEVKDGKLTTTGMVTIDNKAIKNMKVRIKAVITALGNALVEVAKDEKNKDLFAEGGFFKKKDAPIMVVAKSIEVITSVLGKVIDSIQKMLELDFTNIGEKINGQNGLYVMINDAVKGLISIFYLFSQSKDWTAFEKSVIFKDNIIFAEWIQNQKKPLSDTDNALKTLSKNIKSIFNSISEIEKAYSFHESTLSKMSNINTQNVYDAVSTCIATVYHSMEKIDMSNEDAIKRFISKVKDYITTVNYIEDVERFVESSNAIKDAISDIYKLTSSIEENMMFSQHAQKLDDYVKTINSIQLSKISSLRGLVDSMNLLSTRLGNLDNLTDAIANRLSMVLLELVNQLNKADASIRNAHVLQERRKKLIDEAMKKIETLMNRPMVVEITQGNGDTERLGFINGAGTPADNSVEQAASNITDTTEQNSYNAQQSPEEANATTNSNGNNASVDKKALTMSAFKAYMESQFVKRIETIVRG